jgi:thiol-disulfide isomerase/thioredoxin
MRIIYFIILLGTVLLSCAPKQQKLKAGVWRGIITLQGQRLPFNFEVVGDTAGNKVYLRNGDERLLLDEISVAGDTVNMVLHIFDAELRAKIDGDHLSGYYIRNYAKDYKFPFTATYGEDFRFEKPGTASMDFSGKYAVRFISEKDTTVSVGIFHQKNNHVTGTFLLPDGDYRYLEGNVVNGQLMLSTFDGNHAYLFTATKSGDRLKGDFYAGKSSHKTWIGIHNENAIMPDPESLTYLKPGYEKIEFSFPDLNKQNISPTDERYKNKVLILQISGTWCPNCMDETRFLAPWYRENKKRGVEIIGLAYERKDDFDYASTRIKKMKEKLCVDYEVLFAGVNDNVKAARTLPALNAVLGFPTTIFVGKDGKVKRIHTGFSGPGTGIYYDQFIQRFNEIVNELLKEEVISKK